MKTTSRPSPGLGSAHGYSHAHAISHSSQPSRSSRTTKSTTPLASPRGPYSVGQNQPPRPSPNRSVPEPRASSPNYFGLVVESPHDSRESSGMHLHKGDNSNASSSITSLADAIPSQIPLDGNSEFEAFRRATTLHQANHFSFATSYFNPSTMTIPGGAPVRPRPPRWHTHASDTGSEMSFGRSFRMERPTSRMDVDQESMHDSAYVSSDSKRNSESSLFPLSLPGAPARFESPRPMEPSQNRTSLTRAEDRDPRLSVMEHKVDPPSPRMGDISRASTMPISLDNSQPSMISGDELCELIKQYGDENTLLLDIRSAQNFAQSRVEGALNLCIPTTLLKRATFNIQKLQQTFQSGSDSGKFSQWNEMHAIVVYDSHSSDIRDAVTAQNMIKKFTNGGYSGKTCILRGGFAMMQRYHLGMIDTKAPGEGQGGLDSNGAKESGLAPVIGGVSLPTNGNGPNPFFANIRQNMDLADGVGQFEVARPSNLESPLLPPWLREAAEQSDKGKKVSEKFLHIEKTEKARMQAAYAAFNPNNPQKHNVQLCGVEKGVKNRYKDILPFEHARVKLQHKSDGNCDYINASHITATGTNKRYIASQGPLPATFEDFWNAVWEQDVRVIVMLTAESEGGQLKCHPYWKGKEHGQIRLKPLSEKKASLDVDRPRSDSTASQAGAEAGRRRANTTMTMESNTSSQPSQGEAPYVTIRKFALSHTAHPFEPMREITHLHFAAWPDFGTPAQPSHLLGLVELANVMQRSSLPVETASIVGNHSSTEASRPSWYDEPESDPRARPMLVHCSAGCGRTGAFCTVDSVIDMLKRQHLSKGTFGGKDVEGDVGMNDGDVSPRSRKPSNFDSPRRQSTSHKRTLSGSPLGNDWVTDEHTDLVQKTVEDFRRQRLSMVQSLRQFVLCYETILEWANRVNEGGTKVAGRARSGSLRYAPR